MNGKDYASMSAAASAVSSDSHTGLVYWDLMKQTKYPLRK